mmetsp:Transcript_6634/g.5739  ORF Transcript_6634/g.5739 Transcript_6634/m.5739 type:complete len:83 (+) Transcript_6634:35-283(+)
MKKKSMINTAPKAYPTCPDFKSKFRPGEAKEKIKEIVDRNLLDASYSQDKLSQWNTTIANEIRHELKNIMKKERYKYVVQVW